MKLFILTVLSFFSMSYVFSDQYVGGNFGINAKILTNENHNPKSGYKACAFYGYKSPDNLRMEFFLSYSKNEFKTKYNIESQDNIKSKEYRSFHQWAYMINVFYDMPRLSLERFTPYIGFGLGYCKSTEKNKVKYDSNFNKDAMRDGRIAYQGIIGITHPIDQMYSACLEYRYFMGNSHAKDHSVGISLIKNF